MGWRVMCVLVLVAVGVACDRKADAPKPMPVPSGAAAEAKVADHIVKTADELLNTPPEPIAAADRQAQVAPTALLGTWNIKHLVYIKDGKPGTPEPPIMEGSWVFADGGRFLKRGGNELEGSFVLTKDKLVISAIGPALDYTVDKLTPTELVVTQWILEGMGTTTVLARAK